MHPADLKYREGNHPPEIAAILAKDTTSVEDIQAIRRHFKANATEFMTREVNRWLRVNRQQIITINEQQWGKWKDD